MSNSTQKTEHKYCDKQQDCHDPETTCQSKICMCIDTLEPTGPDGHCKEDASFRDTGDVRKCTTTEDCSNGETSPHDYMCLDTVKEYKTCFCIHESIEAQKDGTCKARNDVEDGKETFAISDIHHGGPGDFQIQNSTTSNNSTRKSTALPAKADAVQMTTLLQIFIPISVTIFLLIIIILVLVRKHHRSKKRKKNRKEVTMRNNEDIQLLDRMNCVNKNPTYFITSQDNKDKQYCITEISSDRVKIEESVGEGAFGHVYKGTLYSTDGQTTSDVAIKILKDGVSNEIKDDFEREVEIMSSFNHDNILGLLGVITKDIGESPYMIFEYMVHGDLAELLRRNDPVMRKTDTEFKLKKADLIDVAVQIANGMTYLTSQHFVHRDLATRNCLVGDGLVVKISDFGMARDVYTCDYYRIGGSRMLPVRWMSPESVKYGRFTTESDIWAYGVVLWEIYSYGRQPYYGHSNEEVVRFLDEGILLQRPEECPSIVYHVMLSCWKTDPKDRHPFCRILKHLTDFSKEILKNSNNSINTLEDPQVC